MFLYGKPFLKIISNILYVQDRNMIISVNATPFFVFYRPGTQASGYTFVQNSKNKGHIPTKEHMTSAAEQHGAAASRNAFAPRMLYSFAVVHAPLSGCAQTDS